MDAWLLAAVAHEVRTSWAGSRLQRVAQPSEREIALQLHQPGRTAWLWLSVVPGAARVYLAPQRGNAGAVPPPAFCQWLRRQLDGARLVGCEQPGLERLVDLVFVARDDLGNPATLRLVAEIGDRRPNLVLVGPDGRIRDALRRVPPDDGATRLVLPGLAYTPPPRPQGRIDPLQTLASAGGEGLEAALRAVWADRPDDEPPADRLAATVFGLSRPIARALAAWAAGAPQAPPAPVPTAADGSEAALANAVAGLAATIAAGDFRPCVQVDDRGRTTPAAWPLPGSAYQPKETASAACVAADASQSGQDHLQHLRRRLHAALRSRQNHVDRRLERQRAEQAAARDADHWRRLGQTLLCHLGEVPKGAAEIDLPSVEDPQTTLRIPLDPRRSPSANAQRLLARYHKEKRALAAIGEHLAHSEAERAYLEEAACALAQAENRAELAALEQELTEQGVVGAASAARRARTPLGPPPPLSFPAAGGWRILVGRNAGGNDHLTMRLARPDDIWLHAQRIPGSHVLLQPPAAGPGPAGSHPPQEALLAAARLAAHFSAGRGGANLPVDWTPRRQVWKPRGARPGFVLYRGEHTLIVDPAAPTPHT